MASVALHGLISAPSLPTPTGRDISRSSLESSQRAHPSLKLQPQPRWEIPGPHHLLSSSFWINQTFPLFPTSTSATTRPKSCPPSFNSNLLLLLTPYFINSTTILLEDGQAPNDAVDTHISPTHLVSCQTLGFVSYTQYPSIIRTPSLLRAPFSLVYVAFGIR